MIEVNQKNMVNFIAELHRINRFGLPNAVRSTLTNQAKDSHADSREGLGKQFILRNQYTKNSILYDRANQREIKDMESHVGSIQKYMAKQEEGFSKETTGKHGLAIPAPGSAGEVGHVSSRLKSVMRRNYLNKIHPVSAFGSRVQKAISAHTSFGMQIGGVAMAARMAIADGSRIIFIDRRRDHYHRKTGFYRVMGGHLKSTNQKGLFPDGARIMLLYSATKKRTLTKSHEWLKPHAQRAAEKVDGYYEKALNEEMRKSRERFDR